MGSNLHAPKMLGVSILLTFEGAALSVFYAIDGTHTGYLWLSKADNKRIKKHKKKSMVKNLQRCRFDLIINEHGRNTQRLNWPFWIKMSCIERSIRVVFLGVAFSLHLTSLSWLSIGSRKNTGWVRVRVRVRERERERERERAEAITWPFCSHQSCTKMRAVS